MYEKGSSLDALLSTTKKSSVQAVNYHCDPTYKANKYDRRKTNHLSPSILDKHHSPCMEYSSRAVGNLNIHPCVEANNKLSRGSSVEIEVVVPWRLPKFETYQYHTKTKRGCGWRRGAHERAVSAERRWTTIKLVYKRQGARKKVAVQIKLAFRLSQPPH